MSALDNLSLNRFLTRQTSNYSALASSPYSGIEAGITAANAYSTPGSDPNGPLPATAIATGTPIVGCQVKSSNGSKTVNILGFPFDTGRVEINQGFQDTAGANFPLDSLTAFDNSGISTVVLSYLGIEFQAGSNTITPTIVYNVNGTPIFQPIRYGVGRVNANGTPTTNFPSTWTVTHPSTGKYVITPATAFPDDKYAVTLTSVGPAPGFVVLQSTTTGNFNVWTYNQAGALQDSEFSFDVFTNTD